MYDYNYTIYIYIYMYVMYAMVISMKNQNYVKISQKNVNIMME